MVCANLSRPPRAGHRLGYERASTNGVDRVQILVCAIHPGGSVFLGHSYSRTEGAVSHSVYSMRASRGNAVYTGRHGF